MSITLTVAQDQLQLWIDCSAKLAQNQSYTIGKRQWTRVDASEVRKNIEYWQDQVERLGGTRRRGVATIIPTDC